MKNDEDRQFDAVLDYLQRNRGFDFGAYKRQTLMRRMTRRLQVVRVDSFDDYQDYLEVHPEEFHSLFNTILINVTSFFRDEAAWEILAAEVLPRIIENKKPDGLIRVWCAGVASGEEAYSIAMLLAEALGEEQFAQRVKIFATDLDDDALSQARLATYNAKQIEPIPGQMLSKYFEQVDDRYVFRKDLRRLIIFGRNDLILDAPISKLDVLLCRNTLMYFNAEAQSKMLLRFHFALNDDGILFLGKSEMLLTHSKLFTPLDFKHRVFTKIARPGARDATALLTNANNEETITSQLNNLERLREAAFEAGTAAQIVVDHNGLLVLANAQARGLFGITINDLGRPLRDLEVSFKPAELRALIEQAYAERRLIVLKDVKWTVVPGEVRYLDVQFVPLVSAAGTAAGVTITFTDVTLSKQLEEQVNHSRHELETAYEELQSTNEELETTNEELQSTNEELETLNEELHSTNEELETMNEELQSTNEELETVNTEMRRRTEELNRSRDFLGAILTGVRVGVLVVDKNLRIQEWNAKSEDLWGLRPSEVAGQNLLNLEIGLPVEKLKQPVRACLAGEQNVQELTLAAMNRRGKPIECKVTFSPLVSKSDGIRGAILLMEESDVHKT